MYVGVPSENAIIKTEEGATRKVKCDSKEFSNYVCMGQPDVQRMFNLCLKAKK